MRANKRYSRIAALFVLSILCGSANAVSLNANQLLNEYNVLILGDAILTSEIQGTAYVGGLLTGNFATINRSNLPDGSLGGSLVVGGDLTSANLESGDALIGGAITGILNNNGGGTITTGADIPVMEVENTLKNFSTSITSLSSTASLTVIELTSAFFSNPNNANDLPMMFGPGTTLFNVSGVMVDTTGFNFNGAFSDVLFNFYEATNVLIGAAFGASILAPDADLQNIGGGINGTVVAAALNNSFTSEFRDPIFTGTIVPLPAPLLLMLSGLAGLFITAKRKSKGVAQ
ncbi:MAG: collagen-binding domain-containing protein [Pseudomonadota bacterium]